ncbi:MAG TPA: ABC transporter substrate-binding protein, partial [Bacteroidia bacterium]|nr:ABC transporter substrate-binding protein [Bacteroidia bacterium]
WDNGQPLTVADIIFTAKAHACAYTQNPNAKPYWDMVNDIIVDIENALKFTVVMKQAHIQNVSMWCDYPIIQQSLYDTKQVLNKFSFDQLRNDTSNKEIETWANQFNQINFRDVKNVSGLGDYKLATWDAGIRLTLVRKTQSVRTTLPLADTLHFAISSDATAQILEFKAQTFDASTTLSTKTLLMLQKDSAFNTNYHSAFVSTFNYTYAAFNCKPDENHQPFFTDKNVRRALALLTPVDQINKVLNQNKNKRLATPVAPVKDECNKILEILPFDVNQAKELLNKSGWIDSNQNGIRDKLIDGKLVEFKFELLYFTNSPDWKDYSEMMATSYLSAGVEAVPTGYDPLTGQQKMFAQNFDMLLSSWGGNAVPEDYTQLWSTQAWQQKGANFTGFGNAFTDSVITAISQCMETEKRNNLSKQLQTIIYDEQPYVFLFTSMRKIAVHKRISNIELYFERPNLLLNQLQLKINNPKTIQ